MLADWTTNRVRRPTRGGWSVNDTRPAAMTLDIVLRLCHDATSSVELTLTTSTSHWHDMTWHDVGQSTVTLTSPILSTCSMCLDQGFLNVDATFRTPWSSRAVFVSCTQRLMQPSSHCLQNSRTHSPYNKEVHGQMAATTCGPAG